MDIMVYTRTPREDHDGIHYVSLDTLLKNSDYISLHCPLTNYMFVVCLFYIFCFIGNAFVGSYRGICKVDVPFKGTTMHVTLRVILSYLLIHQLGLVAVALGCGIGWIFVNIYQIFAYRKLKLTAKGS